MEGEGFVIGLLAALLVGNVTFAYFFFERPCSIKNFIVSRYFCSLPRTLFGFLCSDADEQCEKVDNLRKNGWLRVADYRKMWRYATRLSFLSRVFYPKAHPEISFFFWAFGISLLAPLAIVYFFYDFDSSNKDLLAALMIAPFVQMILQHSDETSRSFLQVFGNERASQMAAREGDSTDPFLLRIRESFTRTVELAPRNSRLWDELCLNERQRRLKEEVERAVLLRYRLVADGYARSISVLVGVYIILGIFFYFVKLQVITAYFLFATLTLLLFSSWLSMRSLLKMRYLKKLCRHMQRVMESANQRSEGAGILFSDGLVSSQAIWLTLIDKLTKNVLEHKT